MTTPEQPAASTDALPRVVGDTAPLAADVGEPQARGVLWKLPPGERDLDANVIALAPGGAIESHTGPDIDVLIHVIAGSGTLDTAAGPVSLTPGDLAWLPRRSRRGFTAGPQGLRYLTVHQKRQALVLGTSRTSGTGAPPSSCR